MSVKKLLFGAMKAVSASNFIGKLDTANQYDEGLGITTDATGNVYLVGQANASTTTAATAFLAKASSTGAVSTKLTLDISGAEDKARAVAVDASGNIYVAGQANGTSETGYAFLVKYTSAGVISWQKSLDTSVLGGDRILTCKLDSSGNVYVLGNVFVAKYNSSGVMQWEAALYNSSFSETYVDMDLDSSGNVYCIVNSSYNPVRTFIIKYSTDGVISAQISVSNDIPYSIGVDSVGTVYTLSNCNNTNAGITGNPIAVSKYNSDLAYQWCYYFSFLNAGKLVVSSSGAIYIAIYNAGATNVTQLFRLTDTGSIVWARQLAATISGTAVPIYQTNITVDALGNMYGIGTVGATTAAYVFFYKFLADGTIPTMAGQAAGTYLLETGKIITYSIITNPTTTSLATRAGTTLASTFKCTQPAFIAASREQSGGSITSDDNARVDSSGNIVILDRANTSWFSSINSSTGVITPVIAVSGGIVPFKFVLDSSNNKFMIGVSTTSVFTAKILADNTLGWAKGIDTAGSDNAVAITIDSVGNVYIVGNPNNRAADNFILVAKYSNGTGTLIHQRYLTSSTKDAAYDIACYTSQNSVCVIGTVGTSTGLVVALYDSSLEIVWKKVIAGAFSAGKVAIDSSGNIYVAPYDIATFKGYLIKYNSAGTIQWQIKGNFSNAAISCDSAGNVYILSEGVLKFNSSGVYQWGISFNFSSGGVVSGLTVSGTSIIIRYRNATTYSNTIVMSTDGGIGTTFGRYPLNQSNTVTLSVTNQTNLALQTSTLSETTAITVNSNLGAMISMADPSVTITTATTTLYPNQTYGLGALNIAGSLASSTSTIPAVTQTLS